MQHPHPLQVFKQATAGSFAASLAFAWACVSGLWEHYEECGVFRVPQVVGSLEPYESYRLGVFLGQSGDDGKGICP